MGHTDIAALIDQGRWSAYQRWSLALASLALVFDGFDNQALALAIPSLMAEWGVPREAFASVFSLGLVGMALGTAVGGRLGDRYGRKPVLIASVVLFGLATLAVAFVRGLPSLTLFRFLTGLGLGGAIPTATALIAESTPARRRSIAVTLGMAAIAFGGLVGSLLAGMVLRNLGWRALFLAGGAAPLVVAAIQAFTMPESPRQLLRTSPARLADLLERYGLGRHAPPFVDSSDSGAARASVSALFAPDLRRDTWAMGLAFLGVLFCLFAILAWTPAVLSRAGYGPEVTSIGLLAFNAGGMAASLAGAWLLGRTGSRRLLAALAALGAAATGLALTPFDPQHGAGGFLLLITLTGLSIGAVQILLYAVGVNVFPNALRGTGIGWSAGVGRIGAIVSPLVASALLTAYGAPGLFLMVAAMMGVVTAALLAIRRHVPAGRA